MHTVTPPAHAGGIHAIPSGEDDLRAAADLVNMAHAQLREARRVLRRALLARAARPGRQPAQCGTPGGYRRHYRADDPACDACLEAWSWNTKRLKAETRAA